jgi:hypothetical protein
MPGKTEPKPLPELTPEVEARFWSYVNKEPGQGPNGECWEWTASKSYLGYGYFKLDKIRKPHRISWEIANKAKIPAGLFVLHSCDNPPCVNPAHLAVGTNSQNMKEMYARGRSIPPGARRTHCPKGHPLSGDNLKEARLKLGLRECLACSKASYAARQAKASAERAKRRAEKPAKTHCREGHLLAGNVTFNKYPECKTCRREKRRERYLSLGQ